MKNCRLESLSTNSDYASSELKNAIRERDDRNLSYNRQKLSSSEIESYVESVAREIHIRISSIRRNIFEIGKLTGVKIHAFTLGTAFEPDMGLGLVGDLVQ